MQKTTFSQYAKNLALELSAYQLALVSLLQEKLALESNFSSLSLDEQNALVKTHSDILLSKTRLLVSREFLENPSAFQTVELTNDDHCTIHNLHTTTN